MMKSFFKKLAFVMALAMVVSMAAPAAKVAVAAEEKKPLAIAYQKGAVITALNLAEVGAKEDLRFAYAPENWKELDVVWTSSNPNVVTVNQNGEVEAVAAGTATVTVAVGTETASIDVYSVDMKAFDVTIGTAEERALTEKSLKVGDAVDFKFFGVKDYDVNRYNCVWGYAEVIGEDVVEFDAERGDIVAKNPGKVVVTLTVINKITLASIKVQNVEVTVESETPVVDNSFTVKQLNSNTVEVTFANKEIANSAINFKASSVNSLFTNDDEYILVSDVKDGVVTVKFYNGLNAGYTYTLVNGDEKVTFDASTGLVDKIVISYKCCNTNNVAYAGQTVSVSAKLYSGDVEVTANNGVNFKYSSSLFGTEATGSTFYAYQAGETIAVTATYYNTGSSTPVVATIAIPVVPTPEYRMKTTDAKMEIKDDVNKAYANKNTDKISTDDLGYYMVFKTEDILGNTVHGCTDATGTFYSNQFGVFRFTTTNDTILGVSESNGALYPRSTGTAVIQVWFINSATGTKTLVGSKQVTVYGPRVLNQFSLYETSSTNMASNAPQVYATIANTDGFDNFHKVEFKFSVKDQLGAKLDPSYLEFSWNDKANDENKVTVDMSDWNGEARFVVTAAHNFGERETYKDVELTLTVVDKYSNKMNQAVTVRIFNTALLGRATTLNAYVHSSSAWGLGSIWGNLGVQTVKAGVVEFENNAYNDPAIIGGKFKDIKGDVEAANRAKAEIGNAQNTTANATQLALIAAASRLVEAKNWYYVVEETTWKTFDVTDSVVKAGDNKSISYKVRDAAADLETPYNVDLSVPGGVFTTPVQDDVYGATKNGSVVKFTFYRVVYNQYTSRYEYETRTATKYLSNGDRDTIGGKVELQANSAVADPYTTTLNDFVQKYMHVTVYDPHAGYDKTLCNSCNGTTRWAANGGYGFYLTGVKTNGTGLYTNQYVDSQTISNWAYVVSIYVTYKFEVLDDNDNHVGDEVVTLELPVNARVEW